VIFAANILFFFDNKDRWNAEDQTSVYCMVPACVSSWLYVEM